jgi:hypothetical protein
VRIERQVNDTVLFSYNDSLYATPPASRNQGRNGQNGNFFGSLAAIWNSREPQPSRKQRHPNTKHVGDASDFHLCSHVIDLLSSTIISQMLKAEKIKHFMYIDLLSSYSVDNKIGG